MNSPFDKHITSRTPMHIVCIADDSSSMKGEPAENATRALRAWVDELYVAAGGQRAYFRFSLVAFGRDAEVLVRAGDVRELSLQNVTVDGQMGVSRFDRAFDAVRDLLREEESSPDACPPFVYLYTDGRPTDAHGVCTDEARQGAITAAEMLKRLELPSGAPVLITIGFGDADGDLLGTLASEVRPGEPLTRTAVSSAELIRLLPAIGTPTVDGRQPTIRSFMQQLREA